MHYKSSSPHDAAGLPLLQSFLDGEWVRGDGDPIPLHNPATGDVVAHLSPGGKDLDRALRFARQQGGPALRELTFAARGQLIGRIAEVLAAERSRWFEIARINSGNTAADAAIDVDGAIATLRYFAKVGSQIGEVRLLADGDSGRIARDPNLEALHIGVPLDGVAVHINAFNFPAWGLWEKAAVSLLAGVPVLAKPATSTAWLAHDMVVSVLDQAGLPLGSLSLLVGPVADLLDHVGLGDVVAFTGSAVTAEGLRGHAAFGRGARLNLETDSVNAAILGPGQRLATPAFTLLCREVVREMTSKAGQKCTAIRRILVPREMQTAVDEMLGAELASVIVGDPANATVTMGPLATLAQRTSVEDGIAALSTDCDVTFRGDPRALGDADPARGAFVLPTLLRASQRSSTPHRVEVFGPVASTMPYSSEEEMYALARAGEGSLAASVFSDDAEFLGRAALALGSTHGRLLLVDPSIGESHAGHGIVIPSCTHGGPGRAGGGEELGGVRGLWLYHQRVAVQTSREVIGALKSCGYNTRQ
jgi:3,4-dehydroadipyl-CoA semialdehyde dehydrogenase